MKTYLVKEAFRTIQGEGAYAGTPAIFLRLGGCNMWSGNEQDRARDAERNQAECPKWCDTDFTGGTKMTAADVVRLIHSRLFPVLVPLLVISGGEPLLQVDDEFLDAIVEAFPSLSIAVETNGTVPHKWNSEKHFIWITLSPKQPRSMLKLDEFQVGELKLVYPAYDPADWIDFVAERFIQPQASSLHRDERNEKAAAAFVIRDGTWRLSLQTHKITGVK